MTFEPARPLDTDVHAFNLAGTREIFGTGEVVPTTGRTQP